MNSSVALSPDPVSVIVCTYTSQRWDKLILAIASIRGQTRPAQEIIVVVDHNQELFARARQELPDVHVLQNTATRGLSNARNHGIAAAHGVFVAFLDDDAIAEPDWLLQMCTALVDLTVLGVGSAVIPDWEGQKPRWFPPEFYWVVGCSYLGLPCENVPVRNPIGASMCVRREVFQVVGGFRYQIGRVGALPVACEETELCIRAQQYWPERCFLYTPQVQVHHFIPEKRATWHYFLSRCYAEGISKAMVARFVGTKDSLSSEYSYVTRVLPHGILRNLALVLLKGRLFYALRASAIIAGLCITTIGYLVGKYALLSFDEHVDVSPEIMGIPTKRK